MRQAWEHICAQFWRSLYCCLFYVSETLCSWWLISHHVASHLFILVHAICFLVERFQVLLIPYLISHRKQFIIDLNLNHLDACGVRNLSCLSLIFGKCFNGISKLGYYEVLTETLHFLLQWQIMLTVSLWVFNSSTGFTNIPGNCPDRQ